MLNIHYGFGSNYALRLTYLKLTAGTIHRNVKFTREFTVEWLLHTGSSPPLLLTLSSFLTADDLRAQDRSDPMHTHIADLLISWALIRSSCPPAPLSLSFSPLSRVQCIPDVSRWLARQTHSWLGAQGEREKKTAGERESEGKGRKVDCGYLPNLDSSAALSHCKLYRLSVSA